MAGTTAPAGIGMRTDSAQRLFARLAIERTRAELVSTLSDPDTRDNQQGQESSQDAGE